MLYFIYIPINPDLSVVLSFRLLKDIFLNLENYFISQFSNKVLGDDGAFLDNYVYSKDAFFENVHFKTSWMSHYEIARRSMLVNISDAYAMNAKPKYALLAVAMPKTITKTQMQELVRGFEHVAREHNLQIIGGDTISNTKLDISVTIVSKTKKPIYRKKVRENHLVAFTGELGRSLKDLKKLQNLGTLHAKSKFNNIMLPYKFLPSVERHVLACMDISDGLFSDLEKLSKANNKTFSFHTSYSKCIACSGEEYELLFTFDKRDKKTIMRKAKQSRTKVTIFAHAKRGRFINRCKAHHF